MAEIYPLSSHPRIIFSQSVANTANVINVIEVRQTKISKVKGEKIPILISRVSSECTGRVAYARQGLGVDGGTWA